MRQSNDLWDNFRCTSIHVTFQKEKKGERPKNIFKGIIAVNFTNIEKETFTNVPAFRKHRGVPGRFKLQEQVGTYSNQIDKSETQRKLLKEIKKK